MPPFVTIPWVAMAHSFSGFVWNAIFTGKYVYICIVHISVFHCPLCKLTNTYCGIVWELQRPCWFLGHLRGQNLRGGKQQDCLHLHRTGWWPDCPERHKMLTMLDPFPAPHLGMEVLNWCMFLILWLKPSPSECSFHGFTGKSLIASIDIWVSRRHLVACVLGPVLRLWWRRDCRVAFVIRDQGMPHAGHRQL